MLIDTQVLAQLIFDAFTRKITWFEAAQRQPQDNLIDTFRSTRNAFIRLLQDLTDAQVAHTDSTTPIWSISETISHLVYTQNYYYNQLLDITTTQLPHMAEAARGFGEGAHPNLPAVELRATLQTATEQINQAIEATRTRQDPAQRVKHVFFGEVDYAAWLLLLLAHETDHYRQSLVMRRLARAAHPA